MNYRAIAVTAIAAIYYNLLLSRIQPEIKKILKKEKGRKKNQLISKKSLYNLTDSNTTSDDQKNLSKKISRQFSCSKTSP